MISQWFRRVCIIIEICIGKIVSGTQKVVVQTKRLRLIKSGLVKHHARDGDYDMMVEIRLTSSKTDEQLPFDCLSLKAKISQKLIVSLLSLFPSPVFEMSSTLLNK